MDSNKNFGSLPRLSKSYKQFARSTRTKHAQKKKPTPGGAAKSVVIPTIIKRDGRIVPFDIEK